MTFPTLETTVFREGRRNELDELAEVRVIADGEWNVAIDYHLSQKHIHFDDHCLSLQYLSYFACLF